jgi:membrane protease YdiL (CAAX protease family)
VTAPARQPTSPRISLPRARVVVAATLVVGTGLLALALHLRRGSAGFYGVTLLVAVAWALPSLVVRPATSPRRQTAQLDGLAGAGAGAAVGAAMFGVFVAGAAIGRHFSFLADPIHNILRKADAGPVAAVLAVALVNAVAEELFFRGSLVVALGPSVRRTYVVAFVVYVVVTAVGGNTALVLAALVMGAVFVVERWWTGSLPVPIATHLVWSTLMIVAFPR